MASVVLTQSAMIAGKEVHWGWTGKKNINHMTRHEMFPFQLSSRTELKLKSRDMWGL